MVSSRRCVQQPFSETVGKFMTICAMSVPSIRLSNYSYLLLFLGTASFQIKNDGSCLVLSSRSQKGHGSRDIHGKMLPSPEIAHAPAARHRLIHYDRTISRI